MSALIEPRNKVLTEGTRYKHAGLRMFLLKAERHKTEQLILNDA